MIILGYICIMIKRSKRIGCKFHQVIKGISPVTYGRMVASNKKEWYSIVGAHCIINNDCRLLERKLRQRTTRMINELFDDITFKIVFIDIPDSMVNTQRGYICIEITIKCVNDIDTNKIELMNNRISDIFNGSGIQVFNSRKSMRVG